MNQINTKILIVDDNPAMREVLRSTLVAAQYETVLAANGTQCLTMVESENPSLTLVDLDLPDIDGIEIVRRLRRTTSIPIIIVSARAQEQFKVDALDAGADDYITIPFGYKEMLARIRTALRHATRGNHIQAGVTQIQNVTIDFSRRLVWANGAEVHLTPREYKLLCLLVRHSGTLLTHREILEHVWGINHSEDHQYIRVYMRQLRQKLESDPTRPTLILNEPGIGYRLVT